MEINEAINNRRSVRKFEEREIEKSKIKEILKAGQMAPSAGNLQARDFILVKKEKNKEKIVEASNQSFIKNSSYIIIVCANKKRSAKKYGERGSSLYAIQDADAATQNMLLKAYSLGLATCWIGAFKEEKVKKEFNIPEVVRPVTIIPIGYPKEEPLAPKRKKIEELIHREKW